MAKRRYILCKRGLVTRHSNRTRAVRPENGFIACACSNAPAMLVGVTGYYILAQPHILRSNKTIVHITLQYLYI